ncbi:MAG: tetratricopeptide repeat protein [Anaerolineae bacterium]|nr:tetratricopeptide repeat protein [Anaerolineae bacterium]
MGVQRLLNRPKMDARIHKVREKAEAIWKKPLLRQYTDHTIGHSLRVISILEKLCSILEDPLTDDEVYVLLCAAFLHDVGMQQEKFFEMDVIKERFSDEEISAAREDQMKAEAIIRAWHHLVGEERIKYELGDKYIETEFVDEVAQVSKGHTKEDLSTYTDGTKAGSPMRLQLLAGLLRLADELDLDYRRVHLDELNQAIIPAESKAHWWKCHYVESVDVQGDGRIQLVFRFSEQDAPEVVHYVPILVIDRLSRKFKQEKLLDILWPYLRFRLDETPKADPPSVGKRPVPGEVLEIFRQEARMLAQDKATESIKPVAPFTSGTIRIAFGETADVLFRQAIELWQEGKQDDALATLDRGASRFPDFAPIQALLADAYNQMDRVEEAIPAAQRAIDSDPGHFLGRLCLGIALSHQGNPESALEHLQVAELVSYSLTLPPVERERLHLAIARSLIGLGDSFHAQERLKAAREVVERAAMPAQEMIETEMASVADIIEDELGALELQEGHWEFEDLSLHPMLGRWATQPPCVFAAPTISGEGILLGGSSSWLDYIFECQFQLLNQAAGFFIRADARAMTGLMIQLTPVKLRRHQKEFSDYHRHEIIEVDLPEPLDRSEWHTARFEVSGNVVRTYVNDQLVDEWLDIPDEHASGKIGFRVFLGEVALYQLPRAIVTKKAVPKAENYANT